MGAGMAHTDPAPGQLGPQHAGHALQLLYPVSSSFFDHSLRLYEGLSRELNFNVMLRQDGLINLGHSLHELEIQRRSRAFRFSAVCSSAGRGSGFVACGRCRRVLLVREFRG